MKRERSPALDYHNNNNKSATMQLRQLLESYNEGDLSAPEKIKYFVEMKGANPNIQNQRDSYSALMYIVWLCDDDKKTEGLLYDRVLNTYRYCKLNTYRYRALDKKNLGWFIFFVIIIKTNFNLLALWVYKKRYFVCVIVIDLL